MAFLYLLEIANFIVLYRPFECGMPHKGLTTASAAKWGNFLRLAIKVRHKATRRATLANAFGRLEPQ
jgi:hypothetical protein